MLNILQHYQKYYKPCPININATSPTQLCEQSSHLNPKYRRYTNCINNNPGHTGVPNPMTSAPQKFTRQQETNELSIGVM